jgi:hypothetical protein
MKKLAVVLMAMALLTIGNILQAQPGPPGFGDPGTNGSGYTNNISYPYVPGLKLAIPPLSGTNLPINLREADPAGTYDLYFASNLISSPWNDVLSGTNGQTNFILTFPQSKLGFFRATRTDTPITNAADLTVYFPNQFVNTNVTAAFISGGVAAGTAILVNDTNTADAMWVPFSSSPNVLLGTNDGTYQVWFGFKGSDGTVY